MPNILIVDDQPCVRELVSKELIHEGYLVEGVGDAESAKTYLGSSRPDLVLLDLYPDGLNGWEVLRDVKKQQPQLPVIILTAYDSFRDDPRLSQVDGYVIKSFDFGELKQKIAHLLGGKPGPQAEVEANPHFRKFSGADRSTKLSHQLA